MFKTGVITLVALLMGLALSTASATPSIAQDKPVANAVSVVPKADLGMKTTCAVCGMEIKVKPDTPAAQYEGKSYYFCSTMDRDTFLQNPAKYVSAH